VRARNSDNRLVKQKLGWALSYPLMKGIGMTYPWIEQQVRRAAEKRS
jgi:GDP-D-mannose 3',5'-epimerase